MIKLICVLCVSVSLAGCEIMPKISIGQSHTTEMINSVVRICGQDVFSVKTSVRESDHAKESNFDFNCGGVE